MTIKIKKEHYYIGIWYCQWNEGNFMGCAWRNSEFNYEASYRFRYFKHPEDSPLYKQADPIFEDRKSWYSIKVDTKELVTVQNTRIREAMDMALDVIATQNKCERIYEPIEGNGDKAFQVFRDVPWAHVIGKDTVH